MTRTMCRLVSFIYLFWISILLFVIYDKINKTLLTQLGLVILQNFLFIKTKEPWKYFSPKLNKEKYIFFLNQAKLYCIHASTAPKSCKQKMVFLCLSNIFFSIQEAPKEIGEKKNLLTNWKCKDPQTEKLKNQYLQRKWNMPIKPICSNSISNFGRLPCGTFSPPKSKINLWLNRSLVIIYYKSKPNLTQIPIAKLLLT